MPGRADSLTTAGRLTVFRSLHRLQAHNRQLLVSSILRRHNLENHYPLRRSLTSPYDYYYQIPKRDLWMLIHLCYARRRH